MQRNPVREQYRENKLKYFTYHVQVSNAFQKDCETLVLAFERKRNLRFEAFVAVWKELNFKSMFNGLQTAELSFFINACFYIVKKYVVFSTKTAVQVGALYLLYAIYYKQPKKVKIRIRLTHADYTRLKQLSRKMQKLFICDVSYIFTRLDLDNAFKLVALPTVRGLEFRFLWQENTFEDNIFKSSKMGNPTNEVKAVLQTDRYYSLKNFTEISQDYAKGLEKYGISKERCEQVLNLPREIDDLRLKMERGASQVEAPKPVSARDLKKKAFTAKVAKSKASKRARTTKSIVKL